MKKILGLDLGVSSIGWALVNEAENVNEKSSIIKLGVRVNPITADEKKNFEEGKSITTNADRTLKRSMRRNLQRYKLRRENLISVLKENGIIHENDFICETSKSELYETYKLRAKSATEKVTLVDFARILLMINKKRGYKSSRKVNNSDDGELIDGMEVAKKLYDDGLTPGQYCLNLITNNKKYIPDFYASDLRSEFNIIWKVQSAFYPDKLTEELRAELANKNEKQTWAICQKYWNIEGLKRNTKGDELKKENYQWRVDALTSQIGLEELAVVFQKINSQLNNTSGYLGNISDRSKELYFNKITIGQYLYNNLINDKNFSTKNKVFYRQDYLDEFETIWETQSKYYTELSNDLKHEIRDIVIFYQRPLKSQKSLISLCEFESRKIKINTNGLLKEKLVGCRVIPKSSPLFQEFKIWQILNNIQVSGDVIKSENINLFGESSELTKGKRYLTLDEKKKLFNELNIKSKLSKNEAIKLLFRNPKDKDLNYKELDGNKTNAALYSAYQSIIALSGHGDDDFSKMPANDVKDKVFSIFNALNICTDILNFDTSLKGQEMEKQKSFKLWHMLYSFEGDDSKTGNEKLVKKIAELFGFDMEYAKILAKVSFPGDYGSLSAKAISKILPHLKNGEQYSKACELAGYRHSKSSLTKDEIEQKVLRDRLEILPKNSLRNPVVEKILNQMINLVNSVSDFYGKPDEIRIELARELKKNAKQREEITKDIRKSTAEYENYKNILTTEFQIPNPSRNDIIRYRLYIELESNGHKTLYSNTYIPREKLFSKEFDIEHIIPQSKLFDDSFANKTLETRDVNLAKGNCTAIDYVETKGETELQQYIYRVETLYKNNVISKAKRDKLLTKNKDIPTGFLNRDLSDSQYIAKKAKEILEEYVKVVVTTTGSITKRLREDWQLVDIMKELNWNKYNDLGLTEWTKRNDHRHHAMDALTIAFTKHNYIQYLNNLNAKSDKSSSIYAIYAKELDNNKFIPPIPLKEFRSSAKEHLNNILVSIKAKNKVVTKNINKSKTKKGHNEVVQLTPRGQLHKETVYGSIQRYITKEETVGSSFTKDKILTVASNKYKEALLRRLNEFNNDAKKAFTGKNSLKNNPIYLNDFKAIVPDKVKTVTFERVFTVRKEINKDLNIEKVVDSKVRQILKSRLSEYGDDAVKAFSNLDKNPIWLNQEKEICLKRVTIKESIDSKALHDKKDNKGNFILDLKGNKIPVDYISTGSNHHVAFFEDENENMYEHIVSFFEATASALSGDPIVDREYNKSLGWKFLFTLKPNEYFVFPNESTGFNPNDIDLLNPDNYSLISPNLFRVQKLSSKYYVFRHHLETSINDDAKLRDITWKRCTNLSNLKHVVKVRINHIGEIVSVGEY